jgi:MerR family copper efflux transcriptional regulator
MLEVTSSSRDPDTPAAGYRVGAAAKYAGVGVQTLHYYEREGLIDPPGRSAAGYRLYSRAMIHRVRAIKRAQALGFTLREIRELIGIAEDRRPLGEVAAVAQRRIVDIDSRIEQLQSVRDALCTAVEQCRCSGELSRCDVLAGLSPDAPELEDSFETVEENGGRT